MLRLGLGTIVAKALRSHEMTSETSSNSAPPGELSSVVRATDEEKQVLLRRAFLIRHGETAWSLSGQHTGTTDIPLTEHGRNVARELAPLLARATFALVLTSPLNRARQTCELSGLGAHAEVDANLMEWNYGDYEGLTPKEIHANAPGWMLFTDGCPGGESPSQVGARVDQVIARIRSVEGDVALFAHGHVFRVFAARWLGLPATAGSHFLLDTATVSVLSHYRGIPAVKRWNAPLVP
jgi:broad specificity phosphatase PhoE